MILRVEGDLDLASADLLEFLLREARDAQQLLVDVEAVECADSSGVRVRVLAEAARRLANQGGDLAVYGASPRVARVFQVLGLQRLLTGNRPAGRFREGVEPPSRSAPTRHSVPPPKKAAPRRSWRSRGGSFSG